MHDQKGLEAMQCTAPPQKCTDVKGEGGQESQDCPRRASPHREIHWLRVRTQATTTVNVVCGETD